MRSGGCVPACSGLFAPGCCFGDNRGGEGVEVRGVDDVTHLVLSLKNEKCCHFKKMREYKRVHCGAKGIYYPGNSTFISLINI